jgi:hypothetical protein
VVDATDTAVSLSVPLVDMSQYKRMSRNEADSLIALTRQRFSQSPNERAPAPTRVTTISRPPAEPEEIG